MDEDLKQFLIQMESRLDEKSEARTREAESRLDEKWEARMLEMDEKWRTRLDDAFTRFSQHILHEMSARFADVDARLASIDERLRLQAGLIQSGARAMARFSAFAENSEERWVDLTKRVGALERKMDDPGGKNAA